MQCKRCKTYFDYEKHYGICPKCAAFNRPDGKDDMEYFEESGKDRFGRAEDYRQPGMSGVHEQLHDKYDSRKPHQKVTYSSRPDTDGKSQKKKGSLKVKLTVAVIIIILAAAAAVFMADLAEKRNKELTTVKTITEAKKLRGEYITSGYTSFRFDGARVIVSDALESFIPEGKKLVVVTASVQKNYRKAPEEDTDVQYGGIYAECGTIYLSPVEQYRLDSAGMARFFDFEAASSFISLQNGEVSFLFVVDETAEDIDICVPGQNPKAEEGIPDFICKINLPIEEGVSE